MVCKAKQSTFEKRRLTNSLGTLNSIVNNIDESLENLGLANSINYDSSFWLRNACHKGFVVIKEQKKVLAQHEGLNQHDEEGESKR